MNHLYFWLALWAGLFFETLFLLKIAKGRVVVNVLPVRVPSMSLTASVAGPRQEFEFETSIADDPFVEPYFNPYFDAEGNEEKKS